jgi:hypothetical protein
MLPLKINPLFSSLTIELYEVQKTTKKTKQNINRIIIYLKCVNSLATINTSELKQTVPAFTICDTSKPFTTVCLCTALAPSFKTCATSCHNILHLSSAEFALYVGKAHFLCLHLCKFLS